MHITQDFFRLYKEIIKHDYININLENEAKIFDIKKDILLFNNHLPYENIIDIVQFYKNNCESYITPNMYECIFHGTEKLMNLTSKDDFIIFLGRSPGIIYAILKLISSKDKKSEKYRKFIQVNFSSSPNPRTDVSFFNNIIISKNFNDCLDQYRNDISTYNLPRELISPQWLLHYRIIRKIVTPIRVRHYIQYLISCDIDKNVQEKGRIIIVDRIMSGNGIRFFSGILLKMLGIEKVNNIFLINLQKENSPKNNIFTFSEGKYEEDQLNFLGDLSIPFKIAQRFDDTPSWESLFNYFPPYYWSNSSVKYQYPNKNSLTILKSLINYLLQKQLISKEKSEMKFWNEFKNFER